eukprot:SAG11_NODE_16036_length_558_cov_4.784314_1_plen_185_part_11
MRGAGIIKTPAPAAYTHFHLQEIWTTIEEIPSPPLTVDEFTCGPGVYTNNQREWWKLQGVPLSVRPSFCPSVRPSVRPSALLSVRPPFLSVRRNCTLCVCAGHICSVGILRSLSAGRARWRRARGGGRSVALLSVRPSFCPFVRPSVRPSVRLSLTSPRRQRACASPHMACATRGTLRLASKKRY